MSSIVVFTAKSELDATDNLSAFITMCRDELTVFGADLEFDEDVWDVSGSVKLKAQGGKRVRIYFSTLETADTPTVEFMSEPFSSFAKADFRYSFGMRPTKSTSRRISALRALEGALRESGQNISLVNITSETFNRAAQLVKARFSPALAYRVGGQLESIAEFMSTNRLVTIPIDWRNPLKRPNSASRVGKEFDKRRAEKLPSEAALNALPQIFRLATEPLDVIVTSATAILVSAPDRINEVLLLPSDCEVKQKNEDGEDMYGLRWRPAKGADPMVKWVIPSMSSLVASAVEKLQRLSAPARAIARWYEKNPMKLFLPSSVEYLRKREFLNIREVALILFGAEAKGNQSTAIVWCKNNNIPLSKDGRLNIARFSDVERAVLEKLPRGFPYMNLENALKFSESLFVVQRGLANPHRETWSCMVAPTTIDQINTALGSRAERQSYTSIFQRHDFHEPDGRPIKVSTQQFRHYLNTLAQVGGLSQLDIAKWSGRKDVQQNRAYDHMSADELVKKIRSTVGDDRQMHGPLAEVSKPIVMSRDEFARLKMPTAHATELGFCIHDYTMAPCSLHSDCCNCNEQVCIKGDEIRNERVRYVLKVTKEHLVKAEEAEAEGDVGASRWVEHHRQTVDRLTQLCEILDDPNVPLGAVIQLANMPTISRIEQAAEFRADLTGEYRASISPPDIDTLTSPTDD